MSVNGSIRMTAPGPVYQTRRARLAQQLRRPLVLCAGVAPPRNYPTNPHPFRAGSSYLYFGGPSIEGAALLVEPGSDGAAGCTLLRRPAAEDDALWIGPAPGDDAVAEAAGLPRTALAPPERLNALLAGRQAGYVAPRCVTTEAWMREVAAVPASDDERRAIIDLRLRLDEYELADMRRAAQVGCKAHRAAMGATRVGRRESDVAAAFIAALVAEQMQPSFTPIITVRGEVLHGHGHRNVLREGALLLVDGGAEHDTGYASDITRTFPVSGTWTDIQRQLYTTTLKAMRHAISACRPGVRYRDIHDLAATHLCTGLVEADLLKGDPAELSQRGAHTLFFPHGVGHLIGLEVHDMEDFGDLAGYAPGRTRRPQFGSKYLRLDRDLAPGMAVTIEPGIYIVPAIWESPELTRPFASDVNRHHVDALIQGQFGGIRIEETVYIGEDRAEALTASLPSDPDAVLECIGRG